MFSELVDDVVSISGTGNFARSKICKYVRATLRECVVLEYWSRDLTEETLIADADNYVWERPNLVRLLRTVRYPCNYFPKLLPPGRVQKDVDRYYYAGPTYYVFQGVGNGSEFHVAYYSYEKYFQYFTPGTRPAVYDRATDEWSYLNLDGVYVPTLGDEELDADARAKVHHWLLKDWEPVIYEGAISKLFNGADDPRAPKLYASYKSLQAGIKAGELFDSLDR